MHSYVMHNSRFFPDLCRIDPSSCEGIHYKEILNIWRRNSEAYPGGLKLLGSSVCIHHIHLTYIFLTFYLIKWDATFARFD